MILTIASHTFREAIRKKTLHILIGLGILIVLVSPLFPTTDEPNARIKMMLVAFFQVTVLLSTMGIIFISATSIPLEIEDKTIYGILSKPISRLKVVVGKITGFALLSAFLLLILSLLNFAAIQWVASGLPAEYKGILKARKEFKSPQFCIQGKSHHTSGEIIWVEGGRKGVALWSFSDLDKKSDGNYPYEVEFNLKIESSKEFIDTIPLVVGIENPVLGLHKTEVLSSKMDQPLTLKIDHEIVQKSNNINITVFPLLETDYIGITPETVKMFSIEKGFLLNYAKAIVITFLKFLLITIIAVMCSTYLSAPLSIVSTFVVFLCGHILDFVKDFSLLLQRYDAHEHTLPILIKKPNIFFSYLDYLIKKPLEWFSFVLPDFKKFDSLKFLLKGIHIPLETIGFSLGYTVMYAAICLFISSVIFNKREFF